MSQDILVVGAGFTGAIIAAKLSEAGATVRVVDALPVASGATQRALGLATPSIHPKHAAETVKGVQALSQLAAQHGVVPQPCQVLHLASTPARADAIRQNWLSLKDTAPGTAAHFRWETNPDLVPAGYGGGLLVNASANAMLDVGMLTTKMLQHRNISVHTGIEINKIENHNGSVFALADGYTIRADAIVLTTNAYAGLLSPYLADSLQFARGAVWVSRIIEDEGGLDLGAPEDASSESEPSAALNPLLQVPLILDNGRITALPASDDRLHIAAWQWDDFGANDPSDAVRHLLHTHAPHLENETEVWLSGVTTLTREGTPMLGRLSDGNVGAGRVYYAVGMGVYGLAWGSSVAHQMAQMVLG